MVFNMTGKWSPRIDVRKTTFNGNYILDLQEMNVYNTDPVLQVFVRRSGTER